MTTDTDHDEDPITRADVTALYRAGRTEELLALKVAGRLAHLFAPTEPKD